METTPDPLKLSPEQIASQLRHPEGQTGVQMGIHMNKGNKHICMNTYLQLMPGPGSRVLEIGMGNGYFVKDLLDMADDIHYTGIDYSSTMVEAAREMNKDFIDTGQARFEQASITNIPFRNETFDYASTTNTIYFWPDPELNIRELARVMKPGGKLVVAYRSREFLNQIALTQYGFSKFATDEVEELLMIAGFRKVNTTVIKEPDTVKLDEIELAVEGVFTIGFMAN